METNDKKMIRKYETTEKIYQQAKDLADLPIVFTPHDTLQAQGAIEYPTTDDPVYHIYYYSGLDDDEINSVVTHELCHVIRTLVVPAEKRLTVRMQPVRQHCKTYHTIGDSISSYPDDLEIERYIATCFDLRPGQNKLWQPVLEGFQKEIENDFRTLPQRLFLVKHTLDYVLMRRIGELVGRKMTRHYYGYSAVIQEGNKLLLIADSVKRSDIVGDREVSRLWIEELGIDDVFSLVPKMEVTLSSNQTRLNKHLVMNSVEEILVM